MDEWHYLTLLHYLDMADGTEGSQKLITFGNLKDGLIRGTKFDRTAEQKLEKLLQDKDPEKNSESMYKSGCRIHRDNGGSVCCFSSSAKISGNFKDMVCR